MDAATRTQDLLLEPTASSGRSTACSTEHRPRHEPRPDRRAGERPGPHLGPSRPLSEDATVEIVRERLGSEADGRFGAACHHSTGGNPLMLRQLLSSLEADGVTPDVAHVDVVRDIGPQAVSRTVILAGGQTPSRDARGVRPRAVAQGGSDPEPYEP